MKAADDMVFKTLQARLALRGFAAIRGTDDAGRPLFIVSRWSLLRQLNGLPELEKFAAQVAPEPRS